MRPLLRQFALLCAGILPCLACAENIPSSASLAPDTPPDPGWTVPARPINAADVRFAPLTLTEVSEPCTKFVEPFDVDDYSGPMSHLIARISARVDAATVHVPRHHAVKPCAMDGHDKFRLFLSDTTDPLGLVGAGWTAATAQIGHEDKAYQQGAAGYGKRYSAAVTDNVTGEFFSTFLYPSLFHQDPRYYRLGSGTIKARIAHALAHRFVAESDSGRGMFNYSEWLGTTSAKALSNVYHPGNPRGFGATASRVGFSVTDDVGWDVLREFWPEVAHKFHLPFRTHEDAAQRPGLDLSRQEQARGITF